MLFWYSCFSTISETAFKKDASDSNTFPIKGSFTTARKHPSAAQGSLLSFVHMLSLCIRNSLVKRVSMEILVKPKMNAELSQVFV